MTEKSDLKESNDNVKLNNNLGLSNESYIKILYGFDIFSIIDENDYYELKSNYENSGFINAYLTRVLQISEDNIKDISKLEIFILLLNFCLSNNLTCFETCCLFSIIWDILAIDYNKKTKSEVFKIFRQKVIKCSMDRPPYQVGIFKKKNIEIISDFYIKIFFCKYNLIKYLTKDKISIELYNRELFEYSLPHTLDLEMGEEILPRHNKALKPYLESKKPKSELEQKIDSILEFERDKLDKELTIKFKEQDENFNKKFEELVSKKKK